MTKIVKEMHDGIIETKKELAEVKEQLAVLIELVKANQKHGFKFLPGKGQVPSEG